jgi:hypothetical protein
MDNPIRLIKQENGNYLQILSYAITHKHMNGSAIDCLGNPNETHVTQNHWPLKLDGSVMFSNSSLETMG